MIVTITPNNFRTELLDASFQKPVAVFFYAEGLPECQGMRQEVEGLISPQDENITLALVDVADPQLQSLAIQIGLQALPALVLFREGRPVDALMGQQAPGAVATMLEAYLPKEEDHLLAQARLQMADKEFHGAHGLLTRAQELAPERMDIRLALAECAVMTGKLEQADGLIAQIGLADQDSEYQRICAALELARQAAESPAIQALEQRLPLEPDNRALREELAVQYSQAGRQVEALELLLALLQQDLATGEARRIYQDILATMAGSPEASQYRRKLYSLLY